MARILLIEADHLLAASLTNYLQKAGHKVQWHVELQAAMDAIDIQPPDLLILDLVLAGRSGVEFLYELRSYPDWQQLPVVVFSSVPDRELGPTAPDSLQQLDVTAYHHKSDSSLAFLARSVEQLLHPAKV